ncbi:CtsR family transcriptional regulator [Fructilactobacillus cliffordii]|uniref:Transcriptional regulator CtsR n=1 Tax=Fructilactobacillus cliffordii TaxID=2940299 RepID=A0A9Q8ZVA0_9LACO|nr:CtsR family transcriptional regulator [Fructilactobacillus cliffordii]USS86252.1 CtsR family transcriptional regulator [Fructilactobacillus cliffordii]USS89897.1 CtsR family transcriptional regulator [Fructilactobacillus cliffordii]
MTHHSMSDTIEEYLKQLLLSADTAEVEIRRSDIADHFDVVPSQINYVIKTRFTLRDGYVVQSKRGGGGYIRIEQIDLASDTDVFDQLVASIGTRITQKDEEDILTTLYNNGLLSTREVNMISSILTHEAIAITDAETEEKVRANVLTALLSRLRYEC